MKLPHLSAPTRCPCDYPACDIYQFNELGMFYQGNGFTKEIANEIRRRVNAHDALVDACEEAAPLLDSFLNGSGSVEPDDLDDVLMSIYAALKLARGEA